MSVQVEGFHDERAATEGEQLCGIGWKSTGWRYVCVYVYANLACLYWDVCVCVQPNLDNNLRTYIRSYGATNIHQITLGEILDVL